MVTLVNVHNRSMHLPLLDAMHVERKRVFVDLLKWHIDHDGRSERDGFDDEEAVYLIVAEPLTGRHLGSVRLLRTDRAHILGNVFPELCDGSPPRGPEYREITRLCLARGIGGKERLLCRNLLARSLVEYALLTGLRGYTGVADVAWLSQILTAGWDCRPLGPPRAVGAGMIGALMINVDQTTLRRMSKAWQCDGTPMRIVDYDLPLVA